MQFKLYYEKENITLETTETFYLIKFLPKLLTPSIRQGNMKSGLASVLKEQGTPVACLQATSPPLTFLSNTRCGGRAERHQKYYRL